MRTEVIDLYSYFGLERKKNARGYLTVYCRTVSNEVDSKRVRPAMLIIPGGGYEFVSEREGEPIAMGYLQHGFNCFLLEYSIAPDFCYPTQIREAAMAMIFIRENAKKYQVDPDQVAAVGFSAGGHLCGCLGVMFNCDEVQDLRNYDFVRPTAVILSYPVTICAEESKTHGGSFKNVSGGNDELAAKLSLEKWVNYLSSPAFLWHTYEDDCVPLYGTLVLANAYNENKVPFELHVFEKGHHGLSVCSEEVNTPNARVGAWLGLSVSWLKERGFKIYS
ncbi:MAG: alpha/beta hydrolase [Clostridia bacterium]|nr:alpha/beta hydrolase [Clostridia bacterium]